MISPKILWRNLFRKSEIDQELSEELASFTDLLTQEKINGGLGGRRRAPASLAGDRRD